MSPGCNVTYIQKPKTHLWIYQVLNSSLNGSRDSIGLLEEVSKKGKHISYLSRIRIGCHCSVVLRTYSRVVSRRYRVFQLRQRHYSIHNNNPTSKGKIRKSEIPFQVSEKAPCHFRSGNPQAQKFEKPQARFDWLWILFTRTTLLLPFHIGVSLDLLYYLETVPGLLAARSACSDGLGASPLIVHVHARPSDVFLLWLNLVPHSCAHLYST